MCQNDVSKVNNVISCLEKYWANIGHFYEIKMGLSYQNDEVEKEIGLLLKWVFLRCINS